MGIVFRQSIKSTFVIFFGALLGAITLLLSVKYLSQQELGFNRIILFQAIITSQFAMLGMGSVLYIFIHKYPVEDPRRRALVGLCLTIPVFVTSLISIFYFALKPQLIQLLYNSPADKVLGSRYYVLLPFCTLLYSIMIMLEFYLNSQMKVAISVFVREVVLRLLNILLIVLFIFKYISFDILMYGTVFVHLIPIAILFALAKRSNGFRISFDLSVFSKKEKREVIHFAWYHMLMGIAFSLMGLIDSLLLSPLDKHGMNTVGIYSIAVFVISILVIPYRSMSTASVPDLTRSFEANDMGKVKDLFRRGGINILIAAVAMSIIVLMNTPNIVVFLNSINSRGEDYSALYGIVPILVLGRLVDMATGLNNEVLSISKHYKFNFRISVVLIVLMFLFIGTLVPRIGIYGAAWGATLSLIVFNICKMVFLWVKMRLQPFSRKSLGVVISGGIAMLAVYFIPYHFHPIIDAIIRTAIMMVVYLLMLILLKPSVDLNEYLLSVMKNKRLF